MKNSRARQQEQQAEQSSRTITIRLRYRGDDSRLERLDGRELVDVPATQSGVDRALKREVGPVVLILDSEEDGDVVVMTLGDPPRPETPPPEASSSSGEDEAPRPAKAAKAKPVSKTLPRRGSDEPSEPIEPLPGDDIPIGIEQGAKILPRRLPR